MKLITSIHDVSVLVLFILLVCRTEWVLAMNQEDSGLRTSSPTPLSSDDSSFDDSLQLKEPYQLSFQNFSVIKDMLKLPISEQDQAISDEQIAALYDLCIDDHSWIDPNTTTVGSAISKINPDGYLKESFIRLYQVIYAPMGGYNLETNFDITAKLSSLSYDSIFPLFLLPFRSPFSITDLTEDIISLFRTIFPDMPDIQVIADMYDYPGFNYFYSTTSLALQFFSLRYPYAIDKAFAQSIVREYSLSEDEAIPAIEHYLDNFRLRNVPDLSILVTLRSESFGITFSEQLSVLSSLYPEKFSNKTEIVNLDDAVWRLPTIPRILFSRFFNDLLRNFIILKRPSMSKTLALLSLTRSYPHYEEQFKAIFEMLVRLDFEDLMVILDLGSLVDYASPLYLTDKLLEAFKKADMRKVLQSTDTTKLTCIDAVLSQLSEPERLFYGRKDSLAHAKEFILSYVMLY